MPGIPIKLKWAQVNDPAWGVFTPVFVACTKATPPSTERLINRVMINGCDVKGRSSTQGRD